MKSAEKAIEALSMLAAMKIHYHILHFTCSGQSFYSMHKLFQKVYESIDKNFDDLGERLTAVFNLKLTDADMAMLVCNYLGKWSKLDPGDIVAPEVEFQKCALELFNVMSSEKILSLGANDLIMSICSEREKFLGMLKQQMR